MEISIYLILLNIITFIICYNMSFVDNYIKSYQRVDAIVIALFSCIIITAIYYLTPSILKLIEQIKITY